MIVDVLGKFSRDAIATMKGQVTSTPSRLRSFRSDFNKIAEQFSACLANGKPKIYIRHPSDKEREKTDRVEIDLLTDSENEDDEDPIVDRRKNNKRATTETPSKSKRQKTEDGFQLLETPPPHPMGSASTSIRLFKHELPSFTRTAARNNPGPFTGTIFEDFSDIGSGFGNLATIREAIKTHSISGLSVTVDVATHEELCLRSVKPWLRPAEAFGEKAISMVRNHLEKILDEHLRIHAQTHLPTAARKALREFVDIYADKQRAAIREVYKDEEHVITLSNELLQHFKVREFEALVNRRKRYLLQLEVEHQMRVNPKKRLDERLSSEEKTKAMEKMRADIKEDDLLKKKMGAFTTELEVIAIVRAYYIVASQRFVDNVVHKIHSIFFKGVEEGITSYVEEKIGVNSNEGMYIDSHIQDALTNL